MALSRPEPGLHAYSFEVGLARSLADLSVRCALTAMAIPAFAFLVAVALGHDFGGSEGRASEPLMVLALGSWVLEPMLALTAVATALIASAAVLLSSAPVRLKLRLAASRVALSVLSLLLAVVYDGYLLPDLV